MVLESEQLVRLAPPDDLPRAREALFEFERDKHPTISYLWITGVSKNFVKLRFSVDARLRDELVDARRAVLSTLGAALEPHLKLVVPKAENPGVSMAFDAAGSDEAMAMGLMYLMLLTTIANESPAQLPVCGGEFVPTYSNELAAFQGAFVDGPSGDSKFGKRIAAVSKAGFLEEFVWVERHRGAWGVTPPKGLTLAEYESWRKKKLKRLRIPDFGSVVIDHPRPLPVEPPAP